MGKTLGLFQNVETGATHCCHCSFPFPVLFPASVVGFALKLHLLTSFVRALYAVACVGVRVNLSKLVLSLYHIGPGD